VITRLLILAVLMMLVVRAIRLVMRGVLEAAGPAPRQDTGRAPVKLVRDPVCGTHIPAGGELSLTSGATTYYFCSEACRAKYRKSA
jgi:YHS domain-containing protein